MKKIIGLFGLIAFFIFQGCDTVHESTINADGSGVFVSTMDMGKLFGMVKMFAQEKDEMKDLEGKKKDTLLNLKSMKDSLKNLTDAEKKLIDKGTLRVTMDMQEEKFLLAYTFPFTQPSDIAVINSILKKTKQTMLTDQLDKIIGSAKNETDTAKMDYQDNSLLSGWDKDDNNTIDDYYIFTFEKGKIKKKLNKEMYAKVNDDKSLSAMQQMGQMGVSPSVKTIFNLPRPAKKAEGKGVKLSADRKKVTIEGSLDDFFEDGSHFEYEIEY